MKYRTRCPACDETVSVWRVLAAPSWWHLRCSRCNKRLATVWTPALVALTILEIVAAVAGGVAVGFLFVNGISLWYILPLAAVVVLLDLLTSILIVNKDLLRRPK